MENAQQIIWHPLIGKDAVLPEEYTPKYSNDNHTQSDYVLVWDDFFGPEIDRLWNGEWSSDRKRKSGKVMEPAVCHRKVAWAEITPPDGYPKIK